MIYLQTNSYNPWIETKQISVAAAVLGKTFSWLIRSMRCLSFKDDVLVLASTAQYVPQESKLQLRFSLALRCSWGAVCTRQMMAALCRAGKPLAQGSCCSYSIAAIAAIRADACVNLQQTALFPSSFIRSGLTTEAFDRSLPQQAAAADGTAEVLSAEAPVENFLESEGLWNLGFTIGVGLPAIVPDVSLLQSLT